MSLLGLFKLSMNIGTFFFFNCLSRSSNKTVSLETKLEEKTVCNFMFHKVHNIQNSTDQAVNIGKYKHAVLGIEWPFFRLRKVKSNFEKNKICLRQEEKKISPLWPCINTS